MNISQIEANLKKLVASFSQETFIYDLLLAYGLPKASITRLKKGNLNLSKIEGEVSWKKKLFFKEEFEADLLRWYPLIGQFSCIAKVQSSA